MADAYVIEVDGRSAGIVARDHHHEAFTFFAAHRAFHPLEGKRFAAPSAATKAARQLIVRGKTRHRKSQTPAEPRGLHP